MWPELPGVQIPGEIRGTKGERTDGRGQRRIQKRSCLCHLNCRKMLKRAHTVELNTHNENGEVGAIPSHLDNNAERESMRFRRNSRERTQREIIKCAIAKKNQPKIMRHTTSSAKEIEATQPSPQLYLCAINSGTHFIATSKNKTIIAMFPGIIIMCETIKMCW